MGRYSNLHPTPFRGANVNAFEKDAFLQRTGSYVAVRRKGNYCFPGVDGDKDVVQLSLEERHNLHRVSAVTSIIPMLMPSKQANAATPLGSNSTRIRLSTGKSGTQNNAAVPWVSPCCTPLGRQSIFCAFFLETT